MAIRTPVTVIHLPMRMRRQDRTFIHTYKCDGNPLPSFEGEPKLVEIPSDIDEFTDLLWKSLNQDNKVSLFVRFIDIETGKYESGS